MKDVLTEKTLVPISLVLILIGGMAWLTTIANQSHASATAIKELNLRQNEYNETLRSIDQRLSRIEGRLGVSGK